MEGGISVGETVPAMIIAMGTTISGLAGDARWIYFTA